jgi:hypothetical protein
LHTLRPGIRYALECLARCMLILLIWLPYLRCERFGLVAPSVDMAINKKAPQRLGFGALIKGGKVLEI